MKNIKPKWIKTCIAIPIRVYQSDVQRAIRDDSAKVGVASGDVVSDLCLSQDSIKTIMADFYGVKKITHIHADNALHTNIWLEIEN